MRPSPPPLPPLLPLPATTSPISTPRTVLVTGGAGFIGANVVHRLLDAGEHVRVLDNLSRPGVERNLRWLKETHDPSGRLELMVGPSCDVRDPDIVHRAVEGIEHVFHFAAQVAATRSMVDPVADFAVNAVGTLNVLEAIRSQPVPPSILYTSTSKVYGALGDIALRLDQGTSSRYLPEDPMTLRVGISEDRSLSFHSPHGSSKGTADQYVLAYAKSYGIRAVVFRLSCIYGPHQFGNEDQGWIAHFIARALRDEPITIHGDGRQVRDILYVDDLIDALLRARTDIRRLSGRAFNVGGGPERSISLVDLLNEIERREQRSVRLSFTHWRVADQRYYVSDTRAFRSATGWAPRTLAMDGIGRLFDWLVQSQTDLEADRSSAAAAAVAAAAARGTSPYAVAP